MNSGNNFRKIVLVCLIGALGVLVLLAPVLAQQAQDPLPS
jgi:uncharacterized membrane protein YdfJ with MMPL/SSD domain